MFSKWWLKQSLHSSLKNTGSNVLRALWEHPEGRNPKTQQKRNKKGYRLNSTWT